MIEGKDLFKLIEVWLKGNVVIPDEFSNLSASELLEMLYKDR